jgi:hypothetical protein
MSSTAILLADTLTFLAFLHAHDTRPLGLRWLPPTALRHMNAQLIERDQVAPLTQTRNGKRGTTERETRRLRFIHFLCEAAQLVAHTSPYLKPTLRVKGWLAAAPFDQLQQLFVAAYPDRPARPHDELWRVYRLPGWSLTSPALALVLPLLQILRAAPPGEHLKLATLLKLIPLPEDGAERPADILRGLLVELHAFGVLDWHGAAGDRAADKVAFTLTGPGTALLQPTVPAPPLALFSADRPPLLSLERRRYPLAMADAATLYELKTMPNSSRSSHNAAIGLSEP